MRILYISEMLGPHDYRILKMLIDRRYETTLVTYRKSIDEVKLEEKHYDVRNLEGLKIIHNSKIGENTYLNFLFRISDFRAILKSERPDVIHSGWIQTSGFLAALSGFHPHLSMPYGSDISYYAKSSLRNRLITRYTIHRADMVACNCEDHRRIVINDFRCAPEKVVVIPLAADRSLFNKTNSGPNMRTGYGLEGKKIILMMRIFRPEYGVEDFIRALPAVQRENADARVLMLGYGPLEKDLKRLSSDLGLDDFIRWIGYVPQCEVVKYMNISDVYVSTSLRDGSSASLLEAMSCGLPVVVTDIPGNLEWVEDGLNGMVVNKSDPSSIANGINRLLRDDAMRRVISDNNIKKVENFADFNKNFARFEDAYRKISQKKY